MVLTDTISRAKAWIPSTEGCTKARTDGPGQNREASEGHWEECEAANGGDKLQVCEGLVRSECGEEEVAAQSTAQGTTGASGLHRRGVSLGCRKLQAVIWDGEF